MWEVIKMQSKLAFQNPVNYYYRKNLLTFNTMGHCACVHFGTKEVFLIWKQRKGVYVILSISKKKIINTCHFNLPVRFQNWEYFNWLWKSVRFAKIKVTILLLYKAGFISRIFFSIQNQYRYHSRTTSRCGVKLAMLQVVTYERGANSWDCIPMSVKFRLCHNFTKLLKVDFSSCGLR